MENFVGILSSNDLPQYIVQEWLKWEGKWELIAGVPYAYVLSPTIKHQHIIGNLFQTEECPINFDFGKIWK